MIELIKNQTKFNFTKYFTITSFVSAAVVISSLLLLFTKMKYGVDFSGGAEIQIKFEQNVSVSEVRKTVEAAGYANSTVQRIGEDQDNEILVKVQAAKEDLSKIEANLEKTLSNKFKAQIRKVDIVGPKAGAELRLSGFKAMGYALLAIMIYIGLRFDFKYAPGAIVALFHDVSIILGIFALTGTEFTLQTVAALLAVIGYSVNDTVIVYDRVRENEEKYPGDGLAANINRAINDTLSRTILTSGTTLFVSLAMFIYGGPAIHSFFFAITLGVLIGTYSSIFIAAPVTLFAQRFIDEEETLGQRELSSH